METIDEELVRELVDGTISRYDARSLLKMQTKDKGRFWTYVRVLQDRVDWDDQILVRISDHLYVVKKTGGGRVVKCDCGREFGDYRCNWKTETHVRVKTTAEEFARIYYPPAAAPEPQWNEIREFYCPGCYTQLSVEIVPPGYPLIFEVLPDIDRFYREFLGQPLDDENDGWYQDKTADKTADWI